MPPIILYAIFGTSRTLAVGPVVVPLMTAAAVGEVDYSALESLEALNLRLKGMGIGLHLSEVKGPVMDRLKKVHLPSHLNGRIFLSQFDAWPALSSGSTLETR